MMTSTHAVAGATLGTVAAAFAPELGAPAILAGFVGGALPDLDLLATHRRTTHYPVVGTIAALGVTGVALAVGTTGALLVAVGALAAALHVLMDVFGGGVEPAPWRATSDRGVYDHVAGRWIPPRRWVRYAGAPEDLLLSVGLAVPALAATAGPVRGLLLATLACSTGFSIVRRRLAALSARLLDEPARV
jgi:hypothetical protein